MCELPDNYATLLSNVRIASFYASGTGDTRFTLSARSVPIPSATRLTSNDRTEVVTSQNNWLSVTWNLGNEVLSPESGIQTSFLSYSILEGGGESWKYMTFSNGDCPVPLSNVNPITISQCCTERGLYFLNFNGARAVCSCMT